MKPGKGKQKGSAFEREVCKALSLWVSGGKRDDVYWRSAMSGGRATLRSKKFGRARRGGTQVGDLSAVHPMGSVLLKHFVTECKFYKNLKFGNFLFKKGGLLQLFWKQLLKKADHEVKLPMLIAKQNKYPTVVLLDPEGFQLLYANAKYHRRIAYVLKQRCHILLLEEFVQQAIPPTE